MKKNPDDMNKNDIPPIKLTGFIKIKIREKISSASMPPRANRGKNELNLLVVRQIVLYPSAVSIILTFPCINKLQTAE